MCEQGQVRPSFAIRGGGLPTMVCRVTSTHPASFEHQFRMRLREVRLLTLVPHETFPPNPADPNLRGFLYFVITPASKLMSSADIDASHFTTACEASIWPHTYSLAHDAFSRSHRKRCSRSHAHRSLCPPTTRTASRVGDTPYAN